MNNSWKEWFQTWMLERGKSCWQKEKIQSLKRTDDTITAKVLGSEHQLYDVEISIEHGTVIRMHCTCPYAVEHDACKHMAAVLFAASEMAENGGMEYEAFPWREAIREMSEEELRKILTEIVSRDLELQERLVLHRRDADPKTIWNAWERVLDQIVQQNIGRKGYIDYSRARDYYAALERFLDDRFSVLLEAGKIKDAFCLVSLVYTNAMEQGAEADREYDLFTKKCHEMWGAVLEQATADLSLVFYRWFVQHLEEKTWAFGTEDLEKFLFSYAWRGKIRDINMDMLDERIRVCIKSEKEYGLQQLLLWREAMMKRKGCSSEEIQTFYQQYWDKPFVRDRAVEGYLEAGEQEKAIALLQEGKRMDRDNTWQVAQHSEKLIELYGLAGQTEQYREELRFRVCSCYLRDLEYVKKLREILTEAEWEALLDELLQLRTADAVRYELLAYGERWQQLFERIKEWRQLELMQRYAAAMCSWSAETVMECYGDLLKTAMKQASERREYHRVIGYLSGLRSCPGGGRAAEKIAAYWKETYPKRSAMLQELEGAGYR